MVGVYYEKPQFFFFQLYNNHLHVLAFPISKLHREGILFYLTTRMNLHSDVRGTAGSAALAAVDVNRGPHDLFQRIAFNSRFLLAIFKEAAGSMTFRLVNGTCLI
jgi:hypothetical protein